MSNCRCISVNSQIEYEFNSNLIYPQAILIEDINQDNKSELIIGTSNGEILVYKGSLATPWLKNSKQIGCITCMAYDSITDSKVKYLIVHDVLGYVYFFSINQVWSRKRHASAISSTKSQPNDWKQDLTIVYQTKLLINPKSLLIDDLNNNGFRKMIVTYTDRLIRVYSWVSGNSSNNQNSKSSSSTLSSYAFQEVGKFVLDQSWEFLDQIGSISVFRDHSSVKTLLTTQPGGRVVVCKPVNIIETIVQSNSSSASSLTDLIQNSVIFSPKQQKVNSAIEEVVNFFTELNLLEVERASIPTYLVTNVTYNKSDQFAFLITMNGDIFFFKMALNGTNSIKSPIWHTNINALVMKYYKIDINKDGNEELLIATPEGQVFVINCSGKFMCFDLGEPIKMFHLGYYSTELLTALDSSGGPVGGGASATAGTSSEADLHQQHQGNNSAFELALDASPISPPNRPTDETSNNVLCFVYVSSITNRICLLQSDAIIAYSRLKSFSQLKYRCENIFTKRKNFSFKLYQAVESQGKNFDSKQIFDILYPD